MPPNQLATWLDARNLEKVSSFPGTVSLDAPLSCEGCEEPAACETIGGFEIFQVPCSGVLILKWSPLNVIQFDCLDPDAWTGPVITDTAPLIDWIPLGQIGDEYYFTWTGLYTEGTFALAFDGRYADGGPAVRIEVEIDFPGYVQFPDGGTCGPEVLLTSIRPTLDLVPAGVPIHNELVVNIDTDYTTAREWRLGAGAGFNVLPGRTLTVDGGLLHNDIGGCVDFWRGMTVFGDADIQIVGSSTVADASRAIHAPAGSTGMITCDNATFSSNFYGIFRHDSRASLDISGVAFDGRLRRSDTGCTPWYGISPAGKTLGHAAVYVERGSPVSITQSNFVRDYANGVVLYEANATIRNQTITDALDPAYAGGGGHGIRVTHTRAAIRSDLDLSSNTIRAADYGITFDDKLNFGSVALNGNNITQTHIGIQGLLGGINNALRIEVASNEITEMAPKSHGDFGQSYGIFIDNRDEYPRGLSIARNTVGVDRGNSIGVFAFNSNFSDEEDGRVEITDNTVAISGAGDFRGISVQRPRSYIITGNSINQSNSATAQGIVAEDGQRNFVCDNTLTMSPNAYQGVLVQNVYRGSITNNEIDGGRAAVQMSGNCLPHNITRNTILGTPNVGLLHTLSAGMMTTDNQEGKLNDWSNFGAYPQVRTEGTEVYVVSGSLFPSDEDDWQNLDVIGRTNCSTTNGRAVDGFIDYDSGERETVEAPPSTPAGILQLKRLSVYRTLIESISGYDAQFDAFVATEAQRLPGRQLAVEAALAQGSPTDAQVDALEQYQAAGDTLAVDSLLDAFAQAAAAAKTEAVQLVTAFAPTLAIDSAWRAAMLATLSEDAPTAEDLLAYRALGEACFLEHGLAPALYAALYTRHTGTVINSDCDDAPDAQQLRLTPSAAPAATLTLRPTLATDVVYIDGLVEPTTVHVVAADGRRVATGTTETDGRVDVGALPGGVYAVQVAGGPAATTLRFVKR